MTEGPITGVGLPIPPSPKPIPEGETECRHCRHSIESQHHLGPPEDGFDLPCSEPGCGCKNGEP